MDNFNDLKRQIAAVQNLMKLAEASDKLNKAGDLNSLTNYGDWLMELAKDADADDAKAKEQMLDQLIRVAPKVTKFIEHCIEINAALNDEMEGITNDIFFIDDSFFDDLGNTDDGNG